MPCLPKPRLPISRPRAIPNAKDKRGDTPLDNAAAGGRKDLVELLLVNKADVNAKAKDGRTPLDVAATMDHKDVVELLRQHGGHE
jgi:ankyrin repeat protein